MRTLGLLALVLTACSGGKSADSSTTPSGTTSPGTPVGTLVEHCANGSDDDGDGLLDCEDSDCADDPACGESDCTDGLDNDGDSRIDCVDEDCWGNGCAVTIATLGGTDGLAVESRFTYTSAFGDPSCSSYTSEFTGRIGLLSPTGTVRVMGANTPTWTTCDWSASSSYMVVSSSYAQTTPTLVQRTGFTVDPGCPVQSSGFLPEYWTVGYGAGYTVEFKTRNTGVGPTWFGFAAPTTTPNYFSSTTTFQASPCTVHQSVTGIDATFPNVQLGDDYPLVGP